MVAESLHHSFLSPTTILWKKRKKRIFAKKEAEKRNFWKKRGKGGKRGGVGCQIITYNHNKHVNSYF